MGIPIGAPAQQPGNGLAVASMVLGIIAVVLCFVPFLNWILALLAIIFGAIGNGKAKAGAKGKGFAITGLILGIVGALLGTAIFVMAWRAAQRSYDYGSYRYNRYGAVEKMPTPDHDSVRLG